MPSHVGLDGVLITGVYGAGKSSVAAEIADLLERQGSSFAALDLDWLSWSSAVRHDDDDSYGVFLQNLGDVVRNYLAAGVELFVLAGAIRDRHELDRIMGTIPVPLRVVRLQVALGEIERRLRSDPTTGRRDDLLVAAAWIADSTGVGFEDLTIENDGPITAVAKAAVEFLGWNSTDRSDR